MAKRSTSSWTPRIQFFVGLSLPTLILSSAQNCLTLQLFQNNSNCRTGGTFNFFVSFWYKRDPAEVSTTTQTVTVQALLLLLLLWGPVASWYSHCLSVSMKGSYEQSIFSGSECRLVFSPQTIMEVTKYHSWRGHDPYFALKIVKREKWVQRIRKVVDVDESRSPDEARSCPLWLPVVAKVQGFTLAEKIITAMKWKIDFFQSVISQCAACLPLDDIFLLSSGYSIKIKVFLCWSWCSIVSMKLLCYIFSDFEELMNASFELFYSFK